MQRLGHQNLQCSKNSSPERPSIFLTLQQESQRFPQPGNTHLRPGLSFVETEQEKLDPSVQPIAGRPATAVNESPTAVDQPSITTGLTSTSPRCACFRAAHRVIAQHGPIAPHVCGRGRRAIGQACVPCIASAAALICDGVLGEDVCHLARVLPTPPSPLSMDGQDAALTRSSRVPAVGQACCCMWCMHADTRCGQKLYLINIEGVGGCKSCRRKKQRQKRSQS